MNILSWNATSLLSWALTAKSDPLLQHTCWLIDFVTRCLYTMQFWSCHIAYRVLKLISLCWKDRDTFRKIIQFATTSQSTVSLNRDSLSLSSKTLRVSCWEWLPQILIKGVIAMSQVSCTSTSRGTELGPLSAMLVDQLTFLVVCRQKY